ncbi:hypothetical protein Hanom_Chr16g01462801 [Helianthus anomalus]
MVFGVLCEFLIEGRRCCVIKFGILYLMAFLVRMVCDFLFGLNPTRGTDDVKLKLVQNNGFIISSGLL